MAETTINDLELLVINTKNDLSKLILTIKDRYYTKNGTYEIPDKYLQKIEILVNSIELINYLNETLNVLQKQLSIERINYANKIQDIEILNRNIKNLKRQIEF